MGIDEKAQETAAEGHSTFIKPLKQYFYQKYRNFGFFLVCFYFK